MTPQISTAGPNTVRHAPVKQEQSAPSSQQTCHWANKAIFGYQYRMRDVETRPYRSEDYSACLAIFDSNVPTYFAPHEREEFCQYLDSVNATDKLYLVLTHKGSVIACGGLMTEAEKRKARFAWGMVDRALHEKGYGTCLTQARLALAHTISNISEIGLETSQHTHGFYERFGFAVSKITPDGFAPGLDRWDMIKRFEKAK